MGPAQSATQLRRVFRDKAWLLTEGVPAGLGGVAAVKYNQPFLESVPDFK